MLGYHEIVDIVVERKLLKRVIIIYQGTNWQDQSSFSVSFQTISFTKMTESLIDCSLKRFVHSWMTNHLIEDSIIHEAPIVIVLSSVLSPIMLMNFYKFCIDFLFFFLSLPSYKLVSDTSVLMPQMPQTTLATGWSASRLHNLLQSLNA